MYSAGIHSSAYFDAGEWTCIFIPCDAAQCQTATGLVIIWGFQLSSVNAGPLCI